MLDECVSSLFSDNLPFIDTRLASLAFLFPFLIKRCCYLECRSILYVLHQAKLVTHHWLVGPCELSWTLTSPASSPPLVAGLSLPMSPVCHGLPSIWPQQCMSVPSAAWGAYITLLVLVGSLLTRMPASANK